jgi:hypothetical protein
MGRSFGKYRSRRSKQAAKSKQQKKEKTPEPESESDSQSESEGEQSPRGGALENYMDKMHGDSVNALRGLVPNRLHVDTLEPDMLAKTVSVLDDHEFKGLKHAAHYILGNHHHADSIFHHRHRASQPMKHFQKIAESTRGELTRHLAGSEKMHRAVHEAMHSAHLGGGFEYSHAIHIAEHLHDLHEPVGGGAFDTLVNAAKRVADPVEQVVAGKNEYDQVRLGDWSARGVANNAAHAFAGNTRMAAAHLKATSIVAPEFAPALIPASEGFVGMSKAASYSTRLL